MNSQKVFKNKIRIKALEPLKLHTTFQIGGRAQYWYEPKSKQELISFLKTSDISLPIFVIGSGSNILVKDGIIKKIFVYLKGAEFEKIEVKGTAIVVGAGVKIGKLISVLSAKDIGGYEFLSGIPGTIGGAVVMNAGARAELSSGSSYREMKDIVEEVEVLNRQGEIIKLKNNEIKFSYRNSGLKSYIIISAKLRLGKACKKDVQKIIKKAIINRINNQDWEHPSAGSFFKNPAQGETAGELIDLCNLKGFGVGGAEVSKKHANFIINVKNAKSNDVIRLMEIITKKVYNQFKINLIPEVEIVS